MWEVAWVQMSLIFMGKYPTMQSHISVEIKVVECTETHDVSDTIIICQNHVKGVIVKP